MIEIFVDFSTISPFYWYFKAVEVIEPARASFKNVNQILSLSHFSFVIWLVLSIHFDSEINGTKIEEKLNSARTLHKKQNCQQNAFFHFCSKFSKLALLMFLWQCYCGCLATSWPCVFGLTEGLADWSKLIYGGWTRTNRDRKSCSACQEKRKTSRNMTKKHGRT